MDSKPRPYPISAKLSSFSVCLSISLRREADVVDRSKVISRERASERETRRFNRITVGSKLASGNWRTGVVDQSYTGRRGSYIARIPKRSVIDRQTSDDGYYLDESNETTHRRARDRQRRTEEGVDGGRGWSRRGDGNKGSGETLVAGYTCDSCADQRLGTITIPCTLVCV